MPRARGDSSAINLASPTFSSPRARSPSDDPHSGRKSPFHHQRERSLSISRPGSPLRPGQELPRRISLATKRSVTAPYVPHASPREIPARRQSILSQASSPATPPSSFPKHLQILHQPRQRKRSLSSSPKVGTFENLPREHERRRSISALKISETAEGTLRGLLNRGHSSPALHRSQSTRILPQRPHPRRVVSAQVVISDADGYVSRWLRRDEPEDQVMPKTAAVRVLQSAVSSDGERGVRVYGALGRRQPSTAPIEGIPVLSLASPSPKCDPPELPFFQRSVTAPVFRHAGAPSPLAPLTTLVVQQTTISTPGSPVCETPVSRSESPSPTFDVKRAGFALKLKAGYVSFGDVGLECPHELDPETEAQSQGQGQERAEAEVELGGSDEISTGIHPKSKWWTWKGGVGTRSR